MAKQPQDLTDILAEATEPVGNPLDNASKTPPINPDDFDVVDPPPGENLMEEEGSEEEGQEPAKPKNLKAIAETMVRFFSTLLSFGAKKLYPDAILKEGDLEKVANMNQALDLVPENQKEATFLEATRADSGLYYSFKRYTNVQELIQDAPLTEAEQELLVQPLVEVIAKHKFLQVGPEANLVMVLILIMVPRIEPLFPNLVKVLDNKLKDAQS